MFETLKRVFVGRPLATSEQEHQRIPKTIALAVFSSDAISSTAYATEEILFVTAVGASSLALGLDVLIPDLDRRRAPARDRRDVVPADDLRLPEWRRLVRRQPREPRREPVARRGRVVARRLHPDRRGVDLGRCRRHHLDPAVRRARRPPRRARARADPAHHAREPAAASKESGRLFAFPTYLYIVIARRARRPRAHEVVLRLVRRHQPDPVRRGGVRSGPPGGRHARPLPDPQGVLVRRGRAHRCRGDLQRRARVPAAGVEERGHDAWRPWPSSSARCSSASRCSRTACTRTRATTSPCSRRWASRCSATTPCSGSCSSRPRASSRSPRTPRTPTSRACRRSSRATATCRDSSPTGATGSCSRTASLVLAVAAGLLIVAFGGVTNALIPLYAVGVFLSFTLSQTGMVRHHLKEREPNWQRGVAINAVGAVATAIVTLIVATTKFTSGAWVPLVVIPMIVLLFKTIKRHYVTVAEGLRVSPDYKPRRMNHTVVVLVGSAAPRARSKRSRTRSRSRRTISSRSRSSPTKRSRNGSRRRGPSAGSTSRSRSCTRRTGSSCGR